VKRCKFEAIEMKPVRGTKKFKAWVNPEKCKGCGLCVIKCKTDALHMEIVRPPEYLKPLPPPEPKKGGAPVHVIPSGPLRFKIKLFARHLHGKQGGGKIGV